MQTPEVSLSALGAGCAAFEALSAAGSFEDPEVGGLEAGGLIAEAGGNRRRRTAPQLDADAQFAALAAECDGLPPPLVIFMVRARQPQVATRQFDGNHLSTIIWLWPTKQSLCYTLGFLY